MYQWRKFEFFEEKYGGKRIIEEGVSCCSSGRGKIAVGCQDGTVSFLDRGFKFTSAFQAHTSNVFFLQQLKQRNFLLTVGEDEQISPQISPVCLKVFDLDKSQPEGPSTSIPDCIQILRIFTNQFPEAKITSFLVLEEAPPILLIAIGLDNGCIYCIQGDIARERIKRFMLQVDNRQDKSQCSITGMAFRVDGKAFQLFAVTPTSVSLFNLQTQPASRQTLDHIGSNVNSVAINDRLKRNFLLTVGEDEQISPQISPVCLKVFDLDKLQPEASWKQSPAGLGLLLLLKSQPEGPSTSIPDCIQILRIFTNQFPEAKDLDSRRPNDGLRK